MVGEGRKPSLLEIGGFAVLAVAVLVLLYRDIVRDAVPTPPTSAALPNPADYPAASPNCLRKANVSPWVGTPAVDSNKTSQCVLTIHTCAGVKTYKSAVRAGGTGMCDDYWKVHDALLNREICCGAS